MSSSLIKMSSSLIKVSTGILVSVFIGHCGNKKATENQQSSGQQKTISEELQLSLADLPNLPVDDADTKQMIADLESKYITEFDANGDGQLTGDELEQAKSSVKGSRKDATQGRLAEFDTNKDGILDESEKAAAIEQMQAKMNEAIAQFDTDGDGQLSESERDAAIASRKSNTEKVNAKEAEEVFAKLDKDGNGALSSDELPSQLAYNADVQQAISMIDSDGDGQISKEEAQAAYSSGSFGKVSHVGTAEASGVSSLGSAGSSKFSGL